MNSNELELSNNVAWHPFNLEQVLEIPSGNGVYVMRLSGGRCFGRLKGNSDILYIGSSTCKGGLKQRISHYLHPGPTQWTNLRINSYLPKYQMEIAWFVCNEPINLENRLLRRYLDDHDELPPFNHADSRRFKEKSSEASTLSDALRVTLVKGSDP